MQIKTLSYLLRHHLEEFSNDNLHRIAISNLQSGQRNIERWWQKKYKAPLKSFEDHTEEELLVQMLEDYYERNPDEAGKFEALMQGIEDDWDGRMSDDYERQVQDRLKKRPKIDLSKYQDDAPLTEEEEKKILESLGTRLPGSKKITSLGGEEFEEDFLGG